MTYVSAIGSGACEGLVDALRAEFGAVLAARILEAEELDFLWDGRVLERYLGQHFGLDFGVVADDQTELSRVAILSFLDGVWCAAVCVADGDAAAMTLLWLRRCDGYEEAAAAFERAT